MNDQKKRPDTSPKIEPGSIRIGRESLSNVFRTEGGSELSSQHNTRLKKTDSGPASGPTVMREMTDGTGPSDLRKIEDALPGPAQRTELNDSEGPSDVREMHDAEGPIVPRKKLEDHYYLQGRLDLSTTSLQSSELSPATKAHADPEPPALNLGTYSIDMEDRLAQVKASQKETLDKMRRLETGNPDSSDSETVNRTTSRAAFDFGRAELPIERHLLRSPSLHETIRTTIAMHHRDIVEEVQRTVANHKVVVIGMGGNPFVLRARRLLRRAGIEYHYLGYGNYLMGWRRRNALKMWSGWPTFPMIFINGMLIGGFQDLRALSASGALDAVLEEHR